MQKFRHFLQYDDECLQGYAGKAGTQILSPALNEPLGRGAQAKKRFAQPPRRIPCFFSPGA